MTTKTNPTKTNTIKTTPKETITEGGQVVYRTRLLRDEALALRFARCLTANGRFDAVEVVASARAKGEGWFVQFHPASERASAALLSHQREARERRAQAEGDQYKFFHDAVTGETWCWSASGNVYQTDESACSCPDFQHRGSKAGVPCKHMLALRQRRQWGHVS